VRHQITLLLTILVSSLIYSQTEYVEKYNNGQIKIKGFVIDSILTGNYVEYYENGQIKTEGEFKNCEYETNHTKIYVAS
jgi:antitoxin component YwqK of YwqJK toxin-antitoxin module